MATSAPRNSNSIAGFLTVLTGHQFTVDSDVIDNSSQNDSNLGSQQSNAHTICHQNNLSTKFPSIYHSSFPDNNNGDLSLSIKTSNSDEENVLSNGGLETLLRSMEFAGSGREIQQPEKDVSAEV